MSWHRRLKHIAGTQQTGKHNLHLELITGGMESRGGWTVVRRCNPGGWIFDAGFLTWGGGQPKPTDFALQMNKRWLQMNRKYIMGRFRLIVIDIDLCCCIELLIFHI